MTEKKTFYINRNLFGTYNILVRTTIEVHKKHENNFKKTIQEFYNFNEMQQVIKFIANNSSSQDIWVY
ncbi:MAG TPA: hypothetical protein VIY08_12735 [Candidatus Nitrosocosmicus sp.]